MSVLHPESDSTPDPRPRRIQRRRTKGWRMPRGAVYVGRPTVWGNAWTVADAKAWGVPPDEQRAWVAAQFRREYGAVLASDNDLYGYLNRSHTETVEEIIQAELGGRDLACWCPLDEPCHADVLLEIANGGAA